MTPGGDHRGAGERARAERRRRVGERQQVTERAADAEPAGQRRERRRQHQRRGERVGDGRVDDREQQQVPRPPGAEQRELALGVREGRAREQRGQEQEVVARDGERPARALRAHGGHGARSRGERSASTMASGPIRSRLRASTMPTPAITSSTPAYSGDAQFRVQGEHRPAIAGQRERRVASSIMPSACSVRSSGSSVCMALSVTGRRSARRRLSRTNGPAGRPLSTRIEVHEIAEP